jgi:hypothetical protein
VRCSKASDSSGLTAGRLPKIPWSLGQSPLAQLTGRQVIDLGKLVSFGLMGPLNDGCSDKVLLERPLELKGAPLTLDSGRCALGK